MDRHRRDGDTARRCVDSSTGQGEHRCCKVRNHVSKKSRNRLVAKVPARKDPTVRDRQPVSREDRRLVRTKPPRSELDTIPEIAPQGGWLESRRYGCCSASSCIGEGIFFVNAREQGGDRTRAERGAAPSDTFQAAAPAGTTVRQWKHLRRRRGEPIPSAAPVQSAAPQKRRRKKRLARKRKLRRQNRPNRTPTKQAEADSKKAEADAKKAADRLAKKAAARRQESRDPMRRKRPTWRREMPARAAAAARAATVMKSAPVTPAAPASPASPAAPAPGETDRRGTGRETRAA